MKAKKILAAILCLATLTLLLCSCSGSSVNYTPQKNISLNYNNITAGTTNYWIENNAVFYEKTNYDIKKIDKNGESDVEEGGYLPAYQIHGDLMYYVLSELEKNDSGDYVTYTLNIYNHATKKELQSITLTKGRYFETEPKDIFVVGDTVYISNYNGSILTVDIPTQEISLLDVKAEFVGISNGALTYLTKEIAPTMDICKLELFTYDKETKNTTSLGSFELNFSVADTFMHCTSFTSNGVTLIKETAIFPKGDEALKPDSFSVITYNYKDGSISETTLDFEVYSAIAYENTLFISANNYAYDSFFEEYYQTSSTIYSFNIADCSYTKITEFESSPVEIFVTSDRDLYAYSIYKDFHGILHCSADGSRKNVINYSAINGFFKILEDDIQ